MTVFITICARNYLAFAITLGQSVKRHHPDAEFVVWLLDEGSVEGVPEGLRVRYIGEAIAQDTLTGLLLFYNVRELATAVKPHCLAAHVDEGVRHVIYLDPDILVFRPLTEALDMLEQGASGVLTPHILQPLPRDGTKPDDLELLGAGVYNLGFLALSSGDDARSFLKWWGDWLREHCFEDKSTGTFTDQKWVNFAPAFWPGFRILRDATYNVAYWNLPQRVLSRSGADWLVDGRPLTFFHFSGFDPNRPELLSKHQNRIDVLPWSPLARLLQHYATCLQDQGYARWRSMEFPAVRFASGLAMDDICRSLYREARRAGMHFSDPLGVGRGSFYVWVQEPLDAPATGTFPLTRYMHKVYAMRPDVMRAYPDVFGGDREGFVRWLAGSGVSEMGVNPEFIPGVAPAVPAKPHHGVNYVGYLRSELGLGEAARGNIVSLEHHGADVVLVDVSHLSSSGRNNWRVNDELSALESGKAYGINLIHVNADQLMNARAHLGTGFFEGRYNIGVWAWETPRFPREWWDRFALLDEIWVGGTFMAESIAHVSPIPVIHIPHAIEVPDVAPDPASFGLDGSETVFLFMFDFNSTLSRKNPEGAIEAFRLAFKPDDPVRLVVKSMNGHSRPGAFKALKARAQGLRVTFIDEALDGQRRYQLLMSCDAFLSLHRAEGFGLGIAEAMAYGKPVVATAWSGNMDFMNVANSWPVAYALEELETSDPPYEAGTLWAEPDLAHAARLMREIWTNPGRAKAMGDRAREDIRHLFSSERVGGLMVERLEVVEAIRRARIAASGTTHGARIPLVFPHRSVKEKLRPGLRWVWRKVRRFVPARLQPALLRRAVALRRRLGYF